MLVITQVLRNKMWIWSHLTEMKLLLFIKIREINVLKNEVTNFSILTSSVSYDLKQT